MSITTYAELQTAVANWLHRDDLTAIIPDFITLAESRINSDLQANVKETDTTLVTVIGQDYSALPTDFVSPIALNVLYSVGGVQEDVPQFLPQFLTVSTSQSAPYQWAISGDVISYGQPLDRAYTIIFRYLGKFSLSATATTNWLLTNHPDVYLWGALLEAAIYAQDNENLSLYGSKFENSLKFVKLKENRSRDVRLRVDKSLTSSSSSSGRSNIFTGV